MRIYLLGNDSAGPRDSDADKFLNSLVQEFHEQNVDYKAISFTELETLPKTDNTNDVIIAAGGDGTMNSVAACCLEKGLRLLPIPTGTANDFCAQLELYQTPAEVIESLSDSSRDVKLDIVRFNGRSDDANEQGVVLNGMHIGAGATLLKSLEDDHEVKKRWGKLSYARKLFTENVRRFRGFHADIQWQINGKREFWQGRALELLIANSGQFGGGHELPFAQLDSHKIHFLIVRPGPWWQLMWYWFTLRWQSRKRTRPLQPHECESLTVKLKPKQEVSVDGDCLRHQVRALNAEFQRISLNILARQLRS